MPSTTARASIYVPLVNALAAQADSHPLDKDPTGVSAGRLGAFLSQCHLQVWVSVGDTVHPNPNPSPNPSPNPNPNPDPLTPWP